MTMLNIPDDVAIRHPEWRFLPTVPVPGADPFTQPQPTQPGTMNDVAQNPQEYKEKYAADTMTGNASYNARQNMQGMSGLYGGSGQDELNPARQSAYDNAMGIYGQQVAPDGPPNESGYHSTPLPNWQPGTNYTPNGIGPPGNLTPEYNGHMNPPVVHFDQGGTVNIGNLDPNDPATVQAVQSGQITYNPAQNGVNNVSGAGAFTQVPVPNNVGSATPNNFDYQTPNLLPTPQPYILPGQQGGPIGAEWQATNQANQATSNYINAQQNALNFQPQVRGAANNVLNAQQADVGANRAYIAEQQRASQMAQESQMKIQAAKSNTADITAVGQEQNQRNNSDYLYQLAGLKAPVDLALPQDFNGTLPQGTRMKLETLSDWLTEKASDADTMEKFNVEAARLHAANTGQDVTAAQVAAGRINLTLDELDSAAKSAGLAAQGAALNVQKAKQSPQPGLVWNVVKNAWTGPEEAAYDQKQYGNDFQNQQDTPLGGVPAGTLTQWFVSGVIADPEQLRQGLIDGGMDPTTASYYVSQAQYDKANAGKNGNLGAILGGLLGYGNPSTSAAPTTTTYAPGTNQGTNLDTHLGGIR